MGPRVASVAPTGWAATPVGRDHNPDHPRMRSLTVALIFASVGAASACSPRLHAFRDEAARPVTPAHHRAQRMRIEGGWGPGYYLATEDPFEDSRPYAIIDIGYANPLLSWRRFEPNWSDPAAGQKPFGWHDPTTGYPLPELPAGVTRPPTDSARMVAIQFSLPVAFHLLWDPFSSNAPIVNTDYEFGGEIAARLALSYREELRASVYGGHISTHIGDEYTISARADPRDTPFPRINVSYEPIRLAVGYRRYGPAGDTLYASYPTWRFDVVGNLESSCIPFACGTEPFYNVEPSEADDYPVPLTEEALEGSITFAYSRTRTLGGDGMPSTRIPGDIHAALLLGAQAAFPYAPAAGPAAAPVLGVDHAPAVNAVVGWGFERPNVQTLPATIYLRGYAGPNPYGQLRNQKDFWLIAAGLTFSH